MLEEKHTPTYRCHRDGDTFECLEAKQHGYNLESCTNICNAEYFDDMLPKITISGPLSDIVFGIGKWLGVKQEDEYLKYPFDDKYVEMFTDHDNPSRKKLLDEFLDFISYRPNICVMTRFVDLYNNDYRLFDDFDSRIHLFKNMDKILWDSIEIKISNNLGAHFLPDINEIDYLKEAMASLWEQFFMIPLNTYKTLYGKTDLEISSYLRGEIINITNPTHVISNIVHALLNTSKFTGIRIDYDGDCGHANLLIFDSEKKQYIT